MRCRWAVVESLRNSLDQWVRSIPAWLSESLRFEDYDGAVNLSELWELLGLKKTLACRVCGLAVAIRRRQCKSSCQVPERGGCPRAPCQLLHAPPRFQVMERHAMVCCRPHLQANLCGLVGWIGFVGEVRFGCPIREQLLSRWLSEYELRHCANGGDLCMY